MGGRERLAAHSSGQCLFLPRQAFSNKEGQQSALPF